MTTQPAGHTKGPWEVQTVKTQIGHCNKVMPINACLYVDHRNAGEKDQKTEESLANARLIAAAPELLEALKLVLSQDITVSMHVIQRVEKAIAKAEGRHGN